MHGFPSVIAGTTKEAAVASWLEYTIRAQWVVGSNPRKVNGGGRKGIRP